MIGIFGDTLLLVALAMAIIQAILPAMAHWRNDPRFLAFGLPASAVQLASIVGAFALLILGYILSDFSLLVVALNSHTEKPLLYKITASWGNHEGSMLLWMLVLSGFGYLAALRNDFLRPHLLSALGLLSAGLLLFILLTSSPFVTIDTPLREGQGFNPILQDIGLALHPPMLYLGYVGFGVVFAYAIGGMWQCRINQQWATVVHPWIALSWSFLTLGIGLGSWWAYRELGWGGWWFWDPVENVSLLPWLTGTALMHANRLLMRHGEAARWTLLLAILTFAMSLIGTFIVRSGILVSVHSFASDPDRGLFILCYLTVTIGTALWLFVRHETPSPRLRGEDGRGEALPPPPSHKWEGELSRSNLILIGNIFMVTAALTILLAILYPLGLQLLSLPSVSVGPPYFNQTVLPLMAPAVLLAAITPLLHPAQNDRREIVRRALPLLLAAATAAVIALTIMDHEPVLTALGLALAAWLLFGVLSLVIRMWRHQHKWPRHGWAMICGHAGIGLFVLCLTLAGLQKQTAQAVIPIGGEAKLGNFRATFVEQTLDTRDNYAYRRAVIRLSDGQNDIATLEPEIRFYPERQMQTIEASVDSSLLRDIYLVAGLQPEPDRLVFTLHINPAMQGLWLAFLLAGAGGFFAVTSGTRQT